MKRVKSFSQKLFSHSEAGILCSLVVMLIVIGSVNSNFFMFDNLMDVLRSTSYYFIIAAPLTALMICAELDLSFGAVSSLAGIICADCMVMFNLPIWLSIVVGLVVGLLAGYLKAFLVVNMKLPGFITTLGLQYAINGLVLLITQGNSVTGFDSAFKQLGQSGPFPKVYWTIIICLLIGVAMEMTLQRMKFGRKIYAVGGNKETARLAGINVGKVRTIVHILVAVAAALVGIFKAARFSSAQPDAGTGTEMTIMAAVIIGGCGIEGGTGTVVGSFLGCLLIAIINNGLILMHVSSYWNNFIFGTILIIALVIDLYRKKQMMIVHDVKDDEKKEK